MPEGVKGWRRGDTCPVLQKGGWGGGLSRGWGWGLPGGVGVAVHCSTVPAKGPTKGGLSALCPPCAHLWEALVSAHAPNDRYPGKRTKGPQHAIYTHGLELLSSSVIRSSIHCICHLTPAICFTWTSVSPCGGVGDHEDPQRTTVESTPSK